MRVTGGLLAVIWLFAAQGGHAQSQAPACNVFNESSAEQALQGNPAHAAVCLAFGMRLTRLSSAHDHRLSVAENVFRSLQRYFPQGAYAYIGFAELQMRKLELGLDPDDAPQAIRDGAERATHIRPVLPEAFVTLGRADMLTGCLPCAARAAEIARSLGVASPALNELRARIAEAEGDATRARAILDQAIGAPDLVAEDRSWFYFALAELLARLGKYTEADRALADAVTAQPDNLPAAIRRAEIRLFDLGDVEGALQAGTSRRARQSLEFKRVRAMAQYLEWSRKPTADRADEDLRRIVQQSYLGPEDALVASARHPSLAKEFRTLLGAGLVRDVDSRDSAGDTALLAAAAGGNRDALRLLIGRTANVDAADRRGRRPLSFAVERSDHEAMALLLGAGATVDYADIDGRSPLLLAVQKSDGESVAMLLRHREGKEAAPPHGAGDLLAAAAIRGNDLIVRSLLGAGVPVDTVDRHGRTPLVSAVLWGRARAARALLDAGADASRALDAAQEAGDPVILKLLTTYLKRAI